MIEKVVAGIRFFRGLVRSNDCVSEVSVHIDQSRHHGFACEIDMTRTGWALNFAFLAYCDDSVVLNHQGRILNRRSAVPDDKPRSFEDNYFAGRLGRGTPSNEESKNSDGCAAHMPSFVDSMMPRSSLIGTPVEQYPVYESTAVL
jgi:hypothetical protein